jgi:hypothetical protein
MGLVNKLQRIGEAASLAEWQAMAWATRLVMLAAIAANWKKAADTLQAMSKPGPALSVWDPFVLAFALEGAFAIAAYFLSMQVQRRDHPNRLQIVTLALSVPLLGLLSAMANIDYFLRYSATEAAWGLWRAIIMGAAAPMIAVLTAVLAGTVSGIAQEKTDEHQELETAKAEHELAMAKQRTAQARAAARQAKAERLPEISGTKPATAGSGNGHRHWTPETLLAEYPDAMSWTGKRIGDIAGVSDRQGRNWRAKMQELTSQAETNG